MKPGVLVEIPGFGRLDLRVLVSDFTGTLSRGGKITRETARRLAHLGECLDIHILTADTFGTVERELGALPVALHLLEPGFQDERKAEFVQALGAEHAAAFGNGNNDRLLLRTVRDAGGLAVAVDNGEGCAVETLQSAQVFIAGAENALDLLIETDRVKATLRF
jgi:soluble P-type ATPase